MTRSDKDPTGGRMASPLRTNSQTPFDERAAAAVARAASSRARIEAAASRSAAREEKRAALAKEDAARLSYAKSKLQAARVPSPNKSPRETLPAKPSFFSALWGDSGRGAESGSIETQSGRAGDGGEKHDALVEHSLGGDAETLEFDETGDDDFSDGKVDVSLVFLGGEGEVEVKVEIEEDVGEKVPTVHLIAHLCADRDSLRARAATRAAKTRHLRGRSGLCLDMCLWAPVGGTRMLEREVTPIADDVTVLFESSLPSHLTAHIDREGLCEFVASRASASHLISHLVADLELLRASAKRCSRGPSQSPPDDAISSSATLLFSAPPASSSASRVAAAARDSPRCASQRAQGGAPPHAGATAAFAAPSKAAPTVIASSARSHLTAHLMADRARLVGGGGGGSSAASSSDGGDVARASDAGGGKRKVAAPAPAASLLTSLGSAKRAALALPDGADASNAAASAATLKPLALNFPTGRATKTNCSPPPDRRLRPTGRAAKTNCAPPPDSRLSRRAGTNVGLAVRAGRGAREAAISSAAPPSRAARELREAVAASPTGRHERDKCDSGLSFTKFLSDVALVARDKSIRKERWGKTSNSSFANFEQPVERKAGTTEAQHAVFGVIEFENHTPEEFEELGDAKPVAAAMSPTLLRSRRSEVARTARVSHFRIRIRWI